MWKGYLAKRRDCRYRAAHSTTDTEKRLAILRAFSGDPELPEHLKASVSAALSLFDPNIPEKERVKFAIAESWRLKMAHDWAPKTPMGSLHAVFSKDPALGTNFENYDAFYATCKLLIDGGLDALPGVHPIIKATFSFLSGVDALSKDQPAEWRPVIAQRVVACRCGVDAWAPGTEPD